MSRSRQPRAAEASTRSLSGTPSRWSRPQISRSLSPMSSLSLRGHDSGDDGFTTSSHWHASIMSSPARSEGLRSNAKIQRHWQFMVHRLETWPRVSDSSFCSGSLRVAGGNASHGALSSSSSRVYTCSCNSLANFWIRC